MLTVSLATDADTQWAKSTVIESHYLHKMVDPRARPMTYIMHDGDGVRLGVVMLGIPHATRCSGWWGYPGLPTQWQVVDLCRLWLDPSVQAGGDRCQFGHVPGFFDRRRIWRPTVASWVISQVLGRVQRDRVSLWPPVYPDEPYHILLAISYHDPKFHRGTIYRQSYAIPMYQDKDGPRPGSSGKYGWCWPLPKPNWQWEQLPNLRSRNMRLL